VGGGSVWAAILEVEGGVGVVSAEAAFSGVETAASIPRTPRVAEVGSGDATGAATVEAKGTTPVGPYKHTCWRMSSWLPDVITAPATRSWEGRKRRRERGRTEKWRRNSHIAGVSRS